MLVPCEAYNLFILEVKKIFDAVLNEDQKQISYETENYWFAETEKGDYTFEHEVDFATTDKKHFYYKILFSKNHPDSEVEERDKVIIKVLEQLDCSIPSYIVPSDHRSVKKTNANIAKILFQVFLQDKNRDDLLKKFPKLKIFKLPTELQDNKNKNVSKSISEFHQVYYAPKSTEIQSIVIDETDDHLDVKSKGTNSENTAFRKPKFLNVIYQNDQVIGREEDLERLRQLMFVSQRIVLVNGIGGIGKTTFAKYFLQLSKHLYKHIAWISITRGNKENVEDFASAFVDDDVLVKQGLGLRFEDEKNIMKNYRIVIHNLQNLPGPNLLVIDNVGDTINRFKDTLPTPPDWHIILTSRMNIIDFEPFPLDNLTDKNALKLFKKWYKGSDDTDQIYYLLETVGYHTLMVELLAKTLASNVGLITLSELIEKLTNNHLNDPILQDAISTDNSQQESSLYNHLLTTFHVANLTDEELYVLKCFYFLPTEFYRTKSLIEWFKPVDKHEFKNALKTLYTKGWLKFEDGKFGMHRLIQLVVYYALSPGLPIAQSYIEQLDQDIHYLTSNALQLNRLYISNIDFLIFQLSEKKDYNHSLASLSLSLAHLYEQCGLIDKALHLYDRAIEILTQIQETDEWQIKYHLGICYTSRAIIAERYKGGEGVINFEDKASEIWYSLKCDSEVEIILNKVPPLLYLAAKEQSKHQFDNVETIFSEVLQLCRRLYQIDKKKYTRGLLVGLNRLADTFFNHGKYHDAKLLVDEAEKLIYEGGEIDGLMYSETAAEIFCISGLSCYKVKGDIKTAINKLDQCVHIFEKLSKINERLYALNFAAHRVLYGDMLFYARRFELSEEQYRCAEIIYGSLFEEDRGTHIFTYTTLLIRLGESIILQKINGILFFDKAQELIKELIGQGHDLYETYYNNYCKIAHYYMVIEDYESAVKHFEQSAAFYQTQINQKECELTLLTVLDNLAFCYSKINKYKLMIDIRICHYCLCQELFELNHVDRIALLKSVRELIIALSEIDRKDRTLEMEKWSLIMAALYQNMRPGDELYFAVARELELSYAVNFEEWFEKEVAPHI